MRIAPLTLLLASLVSLFAVPAVSAQGEAVPHHEALLDRMVGDWVMTGIIAGGPVTHDVTVDWILQRRYLRIHEVSRELDADGNLAYEAWIHIAWDAEAGEYAVMWLDTTGTTNFAEEGVGHGTPDGDRIPFVWTFADGSGIRNTFAYDRAGDTWSWTIVNVEATGESVPFASIVLEREEGQRSWKRLATLRTGIQQLERRGVFPE